MSHKASLSRCAVATMTIGMLAAPARALTMEEPIYRIEPGRSNITRVLRCCAAPMAASTPWSR